MKIKNMFKTAVVAALIVGTLPVQSVAASTEKEISVKLKNFLGNKTIIPLEFQGVYQLAGNDKVKLSGSYTLTVVSGKVVLKNTKEEVYKGVSLKLVPEVYNEKNVIKVNGRTYLGEMEFVVEGGAIRPINTLPLEDYLKSVVHREMPYSWNIEALKAQAVSARTFAAVKINQVIDDTQNNQVYGGFDYNSSTYAKSNQAVMETKGETLMHNGKLVQTFYSSSNGGRVESNNGAWGSATLPYLQAKADPFDPQTEFKYEIAESTLRSKFQGYSSVGIKTIDSITVLARTEGGYAQTLQFSVNGNEHKFTVKATAFRSSIGAAQIKSTNIHRIVKTGSKFVVQGKGFGHGVGLSQYGAKAMADQGNSYKKILSFYYENASLEKDGVSTKLPSFTVPTYVEKELTAVSGDTYVAEKNHLVVKGDTLYSLSRTYGVTVDQLKKWNGLPNNDLTVGMTLFLGEPTKVPSEEEEEEEVIEVPVEEVEVVVPPKVEDSPVEVPEKVETPVVEVTSYTVKKGDTLYRIATNHKVSVADIKSWNKLTSDAISVGQKLVVSKTDTAAPVPVTPPKEEVKPNPKPKPVEVPKPVENTKTYAVKKGDTLYRIATNHKVSVANIKSWNKMKSDAISVGQKLIVSKSANTPIKTGESGGATEKVTVKTGKVTASVLNVRSSASASSKIVGSVKKGNVLTIVSGSGKWAKIAYGKTVGYVHTDYLTNIKTTVTTGNVKGAVVNVYTVKKGDTLYSVSTKNGVSVATIKSLNKMKTNTIKIGQKLKLK